MRDALHLRQCAGLGGHRSRRSRSGDPVGERRRSGTRGRPEHRVVTVPGKQGGGSECDGACSGYAYRDRRCHPSAPFPSCGHRCRRRELLPLKVLCSAACGKRTQRAFPYRSAAEGSGPRDYRSPHPASWYGRGSIPESPDRGILSVEPRCARCGPFLSACRVRMTRGFDLLYHGSGQDVRGPVPRPGQSHFLVVGSVRALEGVERSISGLPLACRGLMRVCSRALNGVTGAPPGGWKGIGSDLRNQHYSRCTQLWSRSGFPIARKDTQRAAQALALSCALRRSARSPQSRISARVALVIADPCSRPGCAQSPW